MNNFITAVSSDGIPVNVITAIIAAIMQIISNCPAPTPTPADVKGGSFRWNLTVNRAMLMCGIRPLREGAPIMASMQKHAPSIADTDAIDFLTQCGVTAPIS